MSNCLRKDPADAELHWVPYLNKDVYGRGYAWSYNNCCVICPELHQLCCSNLKRLLWHCGIGLCRNGKKVVCLSTCKGAWLRSEKRFPFSHRKNYPKYRPLTSWAWDLGGEKNLYLFSRSSSNSSLYRYCHHDHNMIIFMISIQIFAWFSQCW